MYIIQDSRKRAGNPVFLSVKESKSSVLFHSQVLECSYPGKDLLQWIDFLCAQLIIISYLRISSCWVFLHSCGNVPVILLHVLLFKPVFCMWYLLCRKEGNPFNTTILPSPPAPAPVASSIASAPSSGAGVENPANGPSPLPILISHRTGKSLITKPLTWIAIGGVSLVLLLILCGLVRCFKAKSDNKKAKRHDISAYKLPTKNTKYTQSSLEEGLQMEKGNILAVRLTQTS